MKTGSEVFAIIPARGGSKGIPHKNLQPIGGKSLIGRAISSCFAVPEITKVFVSSDSEEILGEARRFKASSLLRPKELASDTSTSEESVTHWLESLDQVPEIVVFAECTSPFIRPADISKAVDLVRSGDFDSVFSAAETDVLLWRQGRGKEFLPQGHNPTRQTMRQERDKTYVETGAFFVFRTDGYLAKKCRFFGKIGAVIVEPISGMEIDDPWQLELARVIEAAGLA